MTRLRRHPGVQRPQQVLPPLGQAQLERRQREPVAGDVLLGDGVPAEVLDGDPGARRRPASKRTGTSVDWSSSKPACRQPNTSRLRRLPRQHRTDLERSPSSSISTSRPRRPGSKARRPSARSVKGNRPLGRHHAPISSVKAAKARPAARRPAAPPAPGSRSRARPRTWRLKAASCCGPPRLGVGQPRPQLRHRRRPQRVDADPGVEVRVLLVDQPALAQHPEVLAHHRRRHLEGLGQLPGPVGPLARAARRRGGGPGRPARPGSGRRRRRSGAVTPSRWPGSAAEGRLGLGPGHVADVRRERPEVALEVGAR